MNAREDNNNAGQGIEEDTGSNSGAPKGLLRSSFSVGSLTMVSRVFGLIRDIVIAQLVSASAAADAFFVAFKIPNFFRRLFAEGAFNQAFVPVLSDYKLTRSLEDVRFLVSRVSGTLGLILFGFTLLILLFPSILSIPFALGYWLGEDADDAVKFTYVTEMLRITFPYLLLISITALSGSILNTYGKFAAPAFTPVLLNFSLIGAAFLLAPMFEVPSFALAWGVAIAGVVQLLFQMPFLARMQMLPIPQWGWSDPGVKRVLKLMLPAIFGVSVSQLNLLLDTLLAVFLPTGSVSWLYYSDRISELPLGVLGVAIATVILPSLSKQHFSENPSAFSSTLDWAIRLVLLLGVPAAVAIFMIAEPILATLFQYGDFSSFDLKMAVFSLQAYSFGLIAFMLIKILAPGYFAREDMKTPVRIAVIAMTVNMGLNIVFVIWLHKVYEIGHVGLAMATTASAFLNAALLISGLIKGGFYVPQSGWRLFFFRLGFATASLALVLLGLNAIMVDWISWSLWERVGRLSILCLAGLTAYCFALYLVGMRLRDLRH